MPRHMSALSCAFLLAQLFACGGGDGGNAQTRDSSAPPDTASTQGQDVSVQGDDTNAIADASADALPDIATQPDADLPSVADAMRLADLPLDFALGVDVEPSVDATASADSPASEDPSPGHDAPGAWDLSSSEDLEPAVDSTPASDVPESCIPEAEGAFCARTGSACGSVGGIDNCGQPRSASCGECEAGQYCSVQHSCLCEAESGPNLCSRRLKECGSYTGTDNCGQRRNVNCGSCGAGLRCNGQNLCECAPETSAAFCARSGKACGAFAGTDNCGQARSVADCGSCNDANACTNDLCNAGTCRHVSLLACGQECSPAVNCSPVDTDGDGLNDVWEDNGYVDLDCNGQCDEGTDTPLPDANKNKPNVYVKWDYMRKSTAPAHSHLPGETDMDWAKSILASHDIILRYYPTHDEIAEVRVVSLSPPGQLVLACAGVAATSFSTLKAAHFPSFLAPAYHYALFAHNHTCSLQTDCSACPVNQHTFEVPVPDSTGVAVMPGRDFMVSFGYFNDIGAPASGMWITGSFLHQLGHNMGLGNGGGDNLDGKPNYISVMNSSYERGIGLFFPWDPDLPWTYGDVASAAGYDLDFSTFTAATLHEGSDLGGGLCGNDGSGGLDETVGVPLPEGFQTSGGYPDIAIKFFGSDLGPWLAFAGHPVDWDTSDPSTDPATNQHVFSDVSGDGICSDLLGFNDMERVSAGAGVTKMAHLQPNAACAAGYWTNGMAPTQ